VPRLVPSALFMPVSSVAYSINPSSSEQLLIERLKASSLPISAVGRYLSGTIFARMESAVTTHDDLRSAACAEIFLAGQRHFSDGLKDGALT